jgi:hypothetical protein
MMLKFLDIKNENDSHYLQNQLDKFVGWTDKWLVKVNAPKCKVLSVHHRSYPKNFISYEYNIANIILEHVDQYKDLGVVVDSLLLFDRHIGEKVNKAYSMLGIIKRNFSNVSKECFVNLYKSLVKPHVEYANTVWAPKRICDIEKIEKVQMKATQILFKDKKMSYEQRLRYLKLPTLKYRQLRGDMIQMYKFITDKYDPSCNLNLLFRSGLNISVETRGNKYRVVSTLCKYDLRKHFFVNRNIQIWNSLPNYVVMATNVHVFKSNLDKVCKQQDLIFNYKCELSGTGSRSSHSKREI